MEAGVNDLTKRMEKMEHQMRELMQGVVFLCERITMKNGSPFGR
jgi:hypothetical protein